MSNAHKGSKLILKDALIPVDFSSAHFDFNNDATGIQYGNLIEPSGTAVYTMRPLEGKFGGGIAIEEGTTNEVNYVAIDGSGNTTTSPPTLPPFDDSYGVFYVINSDWSGIGFRPSNRTINSGNTYSVSAYTYVPIAGTAQFNLQLDSTESGNEAKGNRTINAQSAGWYRLMWDNLSQTTNRTNISFRLENNLKSTWTGGNNSCWISCVQFERKPFTTSFLNGIRSGGSLQYPKEIINLNSFTVNTWFKINTYASATAWQPIFELNHGVHSNQRLLLLINNQVGSRNLYGYTGNNSAETSFSTPANSVKLSEWQMATISYDGTTYRIYIDGKLSASNNYGVSTCSNTATFNIGSKYYGQLNGTISDFCVVNSCLSDEEIIAVYTSNKPLYNPYDYRSFSY